ncbi:hypothetical protein HPB49_023144 [Dermacentor silvarum]|uniref:Uncharacterized protein n=1 Tax=Dermacentor silvarum TaxID=543639 RepID=A0ACB8CC12_DERSI|nr:hypothetical protein HPB49_023144 [Dermacentor silvarum]
MNGRVTSRHHALKEADVMSLVQAQVISRVAYSAPYVPLTRRDYNRLDVLLRKAYKQALGISPGKSTSKLMALGDSNTSRDIVEVHLVSQTNHPGMGNPTREQGHEATLALSAHTPERARVAHTRRNVHPEHHRARIQARAQALQ